RRAAEVHGARVATDLDALTGCDAVVVATSTPAHLEIAMRVMALGLPVLVEKPLAVHAADAASMVDESKRRGVPIMCGFVERYNPALTAARELLEDAPTHFVALRHSPPNPRVTASVVHDL